MCKIEGGISSNTQIEIFLFLFLLRFLLTVEGKFNGIFKKNLYSLLPFLKCLNQDLETPAHCKNMKISKRQHYLPLNCSTKHMIWWIDELIKRIHQTSGCEFNSVVESCKQVIYSTLDRTFWYEISIHMDSGNNKYYHWGLNKS